MTQKLRIAIIGAGRIGYVHAGSVNDNPNLELVYVVDPFEESAKKVTADFGGKIASDPVAVINSGEIDAVIIGSPTPTHVPLLREAINAGVHALCEKPIDLDIKNVDELRPLVNAAKTNVTIGFNRRQDPQFKAVKRKVENGEIGNIEQVIMTSRDPGPAPQAYIAVSGGIFRDMTIHDFDMARNFVPNIVEVSAFGANSFCDYIKEEGDFDNVSVVMKGSNNEIVTIINSRHSSYGYDQRIEVFGDKGMLQISNLGHSTVQLYNKDVTSSGEPYMDFFLERYAASYRNELKLFVDGIQEGKVLGSTYDDGRAALILADAAHESARTGKAVKVNLN
ncbi:MviM Predicted dehydrogenases and related proteins [Candidatus Nanopelagicaceae bacterium]|jgi:myo-inositol 2-dehydrogenase / D-chiro-inositol 1-dehydrogenase